MKKRGVAGPRTLGALCCLIAWPCLLLVPPSAAQIYESPSFVYLLPTNLVCCVTALNLNGDAFMDLAVDCSSPDEVLTFLGTGDCSFTPLQEFALPGATVMVAADLNCDGFDDLVVQKLGPNYGDSVYVLLNQCDGMFEDPLVLTTGAGHFNLSLAVCDLDGDAYPDIASMSGEYIDVWYGNGDGTFDVCYVFNLLPYFTPPRGGITAADIDLDGDEDLVAVAAHHLAVLYNDGQGSFIDPRFFGLFDGPASAADVCVECMDDDQLPDVAIAAAAGIGTSSVFVFLGTGDGALEQTGDSYLDGHLISDVWCGDFNLDGKPDLAASSASSLGFFVLRGYGDGSFSPTPDQMLYFSPFEGGFQFAPADFDLDADIDLGVFHLEMKTRVPTWLYVYSNTCVENGCADPGAPIAELALHPSCNPFTSSVTITCEGEILPGQLMIYNTTGRLIRSLSECEGSSFLWDGRDGSGSEIPTGTYLIQGAIEGQVSSLRVVKL